VIISSRLDEDISKEIEEQRSTRNFTLDINKSRAFNSKLAMTMIQKLQKGTVPIEIYLALNGLMCSRQSSMAVCFGFLEFPFNFIN